MKDNYIFNKLIELTKPIGYLTPEITGKDEHELVFEDKKVVLSQTQLQKIYERVEYWKITLGFSKQCETYIRILQEPLMSMFYNKAYILALEEVIDNKEFSDEWFKLQKDFI